MKSGTHNSTTTPFAKRRLRVPGACVSMANNIKPSARIADAAQSDPVSLLARVFCGGVRLYAAPACAATVAYKSPTIPTVDS